MKQDCSSRSASCSFFVLVSPAAVVSERFAAEEICFFGRCRRIVDQHHEDLATIISVVFVIVPTLLAGLNAVTDENQLGIDVDVLRLRSGKRDEVVGELK